MDKTNRCGNFSKTSCLEYQRYGREIRAFFWTVQRWAVFLFTMQLEKCT